MAFFLLALFSTKLLAQDYRIAIIEMVEDENGVPTPVATPAESFMALAAVDNFISLEPSVRGLRAGNNVENDTNTGFGCVDILTNTLIPNCEITIDLTLQSGSGGHLHDDATRPLGTFDPPGGSTGAGGILFTTYIADEVSSIIDLSVTGVPPSGQFVPPFNSTIAVHIQGLQDFGTGANWNLIGAQAGRHEENHFGTPRFNTMLKKALNLFAVLHPGTIVDVNDMSLELGGLFDIIIPLPWMVDHREHRTGTDVDLRNINLTPAQIRDLVNILPSVSIPYIIVHTGSNPHIHASEFEITI